jgi:hypothetical protein
MRNSGLIGDSFRLCHFYQVCGVRGKGDFQSKEKRPLQPERRPLQWCLDTIIAQADIAARCDGFLMADGSRTGVQLGTLKGLSMEKWMCWGALGVSGVVLVLFVLDLAMGFPFGKLSTVVDIFAIIACGLVGYVSWDALQDLR